ncbi:hypothetical protein D3C71_2053010 [compost metagenome]
MRLPLSFPVSLGQLVAIREYNSVQLQEGLQPKEERMKHFIPKEWLLYDTLFNIVLFVDDQSNR